MAFTAIPSGDVWVQIGSTQTPTSGTTVSFTSIPVVRKLRLVMFDLRTTASAALTATINNDTTTSYASATNTGSAFSVSYQGSLAFGTGSSRIGADIIFDYTNLTLPKSGYGWTSVAGSTGRLPAFYTYTGNAAINRIDIITASTWDVANTGTIAIYGAY